MSINAPQGMSSVNAFDALYTNAKVVGLGAFSPVAGDEPTSSIKAIQIFKVYCPTGYCDYVRGKLMKVDFSKFPKLDVSGYDRQYGEGAAKKALEDTYPLDSSNQYDVLSGSPCKYFSPKKYLWGSQYDRDANLAAMFAKCAGIKAANKDVKEKLSHDAFKSRLFALSRCEARYGVAWQMNYVGHDFKPCQKALEHFKMMQERPKDESYIADLEICRFNERFPAWRKCKSQAAKISLGTAVKVLESHQQ